MSRPIIPRELVAQKLAVSSRALIRIERLGLVQVCQEGEIEGYDSSQIRRLGKIMTYHRDLGINMAGIEVILRLHDQLCELHRHLDHLAGDLNAMLDAEPPPSDKF